MITADGEPRLTKARSISVLGVIPQLIADPLAGFEEIGRRAGSGQPVRINGMVTRPYLMTRPEHVQHVLLDHADNYLRDGMVWTQVQRLEGNGLGGEGETWKRSRGLFAPILALRNIRALTDPMARAIVEAVDELVDRAAGGDPIDAGAEMTRIIYRALLRVFFGEAISTPEAYRLGAAIQTAMSSLFPRMLLPFIPQAIPVPGDGAYRDAVKTIDSIMYPLVERARCRAGTGTDLAAILAAAVDEDGQPLSDQQIRDDLVAMFIGGNETTTLTLTWLWTVLADEPAVAARLYSEIDRVIGTDRPRQDHLPQLTYTKMVVDEVMRLYPVGWILPRTAQRADVIDGVPIPAGAGVILSPYLTHRREDLWDRPLDFDPERFAPDRTAKRHKFAFFPFGGGPHRCLGSHLFAVEAQLVIAALLSRVRPELVSPGPYRPGRSVTLTPNRPVTLVLHPIGAARPQESGSTA